MSKEQRAKANRIDVLLAQDKKRQSQLERARRQGARFALARLVVDETFQEKLAGIVHLAQYAGIAFKPYVTPSGLFMAGAASIDEFAAARGIDAEAAAHDILRQLPNSASRPITAHIIGSNITGTTLVKARLGNEELFEEKRRIKQILGKPTEVSMIGLELGLIDADTKSVIFHTHRTLSHIWSEQASSGSPATIELGALACVPAIEWVDPRTI